MSGARTLEHNEDFRNYATSSAFRIDLSSAQVEKLFWIKAAGGMRPDSGNSCIALMRRGLIVAEGPWYSCGGKVRLTEAGTLMIELLKLAGLEPTNDRYVEYAAGVASGARNP